MSKLCYTLSIIAVVTFQGCVTQYKKVTKEEAIVFAHDLQHNVAIRNPHAFDAIFDEDAFTRRTMAAGKGKFTEKDRSAIVSALKEQSMGEQIVEAAVGGSYEMVKCYEKNDTEHVIFRLRPQKGGFNYHDFPLVHLGNEVKAADMYIYYSSEDLSKTLADILVQFLNYSGKDQNLDNTIEDLKKAKQRGDFQEALSQYDQLPDTIKNEKTFQLIHLQLASNISDTLYEDILDSFNILYPDEPGMRLEAIDYHFNHREFEKAREDIDRIDSTINSDPFLDYYRALAYKGENDTTKMMLYLKRLYKNLPSFGDGIIELMAAYARGGEIDKAKEMVKVYRSNKKFDQQRLNLVLEKYPWVTE